MTPSLRQGRSVRLAAAYADLQLVQNSVTAAPERHGSEAVKIICVAELRAAQAALERIDSGSARISRDAHFEFAWTCIHRARALLPLIVADDALETQYLYAVERAGRMRPRDARLLASLGHRSSDAADAGPQRRQRLSYALSVAYGAADREHQQLRVLRDRLLRVAWLTSLALLLVVAAGTWVPSLFPLCSEDQTVCPAGHGAPDPADVGTVAFLGLIGAGLTAVLAIRRARPSTSPYRLMPALGFLRIPLGGIVAVLGVVLVQSGSVPGVVGLADSQQIAVYAIVFGFAQEAVTRLLENRARAVQDVAAAGATASVAAASGSTTKDDDETTL
ncbi:hypothetical protein KIN34_11095 [Cellulomonas sp. DKR-3]|uniref:Integral membrane protein n=1 Tax=Cellulomonas fulva TaxID=2835530 RepID=A0ABS5U0K8_9CELL|nr:hypothetical protein [Cellulomonas fulva]MBT0994826.1 hypothetical protein [Cellulomonas fulva]